MDQGHEPFIREAYKIARASVANGDHPFGALLVCDGEIVLRAHNTVPFRPRCYQACRVESGGPGNRSLSNRISGAVHAVHQYGALYHVLWRHFLGQYSESCFRGSLGSAGPNHRGRLCHTKSPDFWSTETNCCRDRANSGSRRLKHPSAVLADLCCP